MNRSSSEIPIRAVVLDVDGTLLGREGRISDADRRAIARVTEAGVCVILATGRIPAETVGYYRELGLASPLVCYHGALVLSAAGARRLFPAVDNRAAAVAGRRAAESTGGARPTLLDAPLPEGVARELVDFILGEQAEAQLLLGFCDRYVINRMGELVRHWDMSGPSRPRVGPLAEALADRVYKVCYYSADLPRVPEMMRRVSARFAGRVDVQQAHAHLAEFLAPGVSKAAGAETALRAAGCGWSEAMAVGDYHNDAGMLRRAATAVAMGNAVEELKAIADFVTADSDSGGVAAALERFVR